MFVPHYNQPLPGAKEYPLAGPVMGEVEDINTPKKLEEFITGSTETLEQEARYRAWYGPVLNPLGLSGAYTIYGIENWAGDDLYPPRPQLPPLANEPEFYAAVKGPEYQAWRQTEFERTAYHVMLKPEMSIVDLMQQADFVWYMRGGGSQVYFEGLDISEEKRVIRFYMGS